jgi:FkbM family methyltransferase
VISYAQNFEDVLLARVFRDRPTGFYLDVGAHDPEHLSVTKHFYDLGWHGINVEPVPTAHQRLLRERPRDLNLAVAAGASESNGELFVLEDSALATLDAAVAAEATQAVVDRIPVPVQTLDAILEASGEPDIDFLNIDVGGTETAVLDGLDLDRYRPVVMVIEATRAGADYDFRRPASSLTHEWEQLVLAGGYVFAYFDGLNRFYVREENRDLCRYFAIPVGPVRDDLRLSSSEVTAAALRDEIARSRHHIAVLRDEVDRLREENERVLHGCRAALSAREMLSTDASR